MKVSIDRKTTGWTELPEIRAVSYLRQWLRIGINWHSAIVKTTGKVANEAKTNEGIAESVSVWLCYETFTSAEERKPFLCKSTSSFEWRLFKQFIFVLSPGGSTSAFSKLDWLYLNNTLKIKLKNIFTSKVHECSLGAVLLHILLIDRSNSPPLEFSEGVLLNFIFSWPHWIAYLCCFQQ